MKKENILKHFFIIGSGTLINMILGFITTPIITRIVDPIEYGKMSIFTMYSNIAVMILCLGLDQALVRFYYEKENNEYKKELIFRCIILPVILSFIVSLIFLCLTYLKIINFELGNKLAILLCIYTIIQVIYRFSLLVIRLELKSKIYSFLGILLKILYIVFSLPMLLFFNNNYLYDLVFATIISSFICLIVSIFSQRNLWNFVKREKKESISIKTLIMYSYPFIISMGVTTLFQAIDKIALNYFCDYKELGIYSSTLTLVAIFAIIQTTFNSLWTPIAVKHYSESPNDKLFYADRF